MQTPCIIRPTKNVLATACRSPADRPDVSGVEQDQHCGHILSEIAVGTNSSLKQFIIPYALSDKSKGRVAPQANYSDRQDE